MLYLLLATVVLGDPFSLEFDYLAPLFAPYGLLNFGTPGQQVACVLDIGTSDTLSMDAANFAGPICLDRYNPGTEQRTAPIYGNIAHVQYEGIPCYDTSLTSSLEYNGTDESFIWNQYQTVQGLWATEIIGLEGLNWTSRGCIGLITSTNTTSCVVGLGPVNGEIAGQVFEDHIVTPSYPNMLRMLVDSGQISSPTYSIWFNASAEAGAVVFGGTDTTKYAGRLTAVPIVSYVSSGNQVSHIPGTLMTVRIMLHGVSIYHMSNSTNATVIYEVTSALDLDTLPAGKVAEPAGEPAGEPAEPVEADPATYIRPQVINASVSPWEPALILETGITTDLSSMELFTRLPRELVSKAANMLGFTFITPLGMYAGSCNTQGIIRFNMSSYNNDMLLSDLMVSAVDLNVTGWKTSDGSPLCLLTILPEDTYSYVLGNGVLRNIYTFVNLRSNMVAFAPLNQSASPDISELKEFKDGDYEALYDLAPAYTHTSLMRSVQASYLTTSIGSGVSVVANGCRGSISPPLYLLAYLLEVLGF